MVTERAITYVCMDANGNYAVGPDAETARRHFEEGSGDLSDGFGFRIVEVAVDIELPTITKLAVVAPLNQGAAIDEAK